MKYLLELIVNLHGYPIASDGKERPVEGLKASLVEKEDYALFRFGDREFRLTLGETIKGDEPLPFTAELRDYDKAAKEALDFIVKEGIPAEPYDKIDEFDRIKKAKKKD